jgi:16S rRNA (guanine527-N7)-methyltransferase
VLPLPHFLCWRFISSVPALLENMIERSQVSLLEEGATHLGVDLSPEVMTLLYVYLQELLRWTPVIDLVSQNDPELIIRKHFLDSLAISPLIPSECGLLDLGSGAGFPGMVLAMLHPQRMVSLIEARRKRVSFLKDIARKTKLNNICVYEGRAQDLAKAVSLRGAFSVVVTRATWDLKTFLHLADPFLRIGGTALIMKGPQVKGELVDITESAKTIGFVLQKIHEYMLPFGKELRLAVLFTKESFT